MRCRSCHRHVGGCGCIVVPCVCGRKVQRKLDSGLRRLPPWIDHRYPACCRSFDVHALFTGPIWNGVHRRLHRVPAWPVPEFVRSYGTVARLLWLHRLLSWFRYRYPGWEWCRWLHGLQDRPLLDGVHARMYRLWRWEVRGHRWQQSGFGLHWLRAWEVCCRDWQRQRLRLH